MPTETEKDDPTTFEASERLLKTVEMAFENAASSSDLFEVNCDEQQSSVARLVKRYTDMLHKSEGIGDHTRIDTYMDSWEHHYPFMPERLLAIEAHDRFGGRHVTKTMDDLPHHLQGYPYRPMKYYTIQSADWELMQDFVNDRDWDTDRGGVTVATITEEVYDNQLAWRPDVVEILETWVEWTITDPTGIMVVNMWINPVRPVQSINFQMILRPDGTQVLQQEVTIGIEDGQRTQPE